MDESIHIWTTEVVGELEALLRPGEHSASAKGTTQSFYLPVGYQLGF